MWREVVSRYRGNPAIWAWEFGNEYSLSASLPNAQEHRPEVHPKLGTAAVRGEHDQLSFDMVRHAFVAFATEVRNYDPDRVISTGDSFPRLSAWHQEHGHTWTHDTPEQFAEMLAGANPDPVNSISLHLYGDDEMRLPLAMSVSKKVNKPLLVGEFGAASGTPDEAAKFRRLLKPIVEQQIPLAALWVYDLTSQPDYSVTATNSRSWQLDAIAEANQKLAAASRSPSATAVTQGIATKIRLGSESVIE